VGNGRATSDEREQCVITANGSTLLASPSASGDAPPKLAKIGNWRRRPRGGRGLKDPDINPVPIPYFLGHYQITNIQPPHSCPLYLSNLGACLGGLGTHFGGHGGPDAHMQGKTSGLPDQFSQEK